jgi:hypothetical protein
MSEIVPLEVIANRILVVRGVKVLLSSHLADLYHVDTRTLNQAVKRNIERFPEDFMFQLSEEEAKRLVSHFVIPHRKYFGGTLPYAFTEQGVAMLSSVLHSPRAVQMNIVIMRTFVKLREILSTHKDLAQKLSEHERKLNKHDVEIESIMQAIRQLMQPSEKPKREIGFKISEPSVRYKIRKRSR